MSLCAIGVEWLFDSRTIVGGFIHEHLLTYVCRLCTGQTGQTAVESLPSFYRSPQAT
jgi:hypothetical protein